MKRFTLFLTALLLVMCMVTGALANATVVSSTVYEGSTYFNTEANTFAYRAKYGEPYQIMDANNQPLTEAKFDSVSVSEGMYIVTIGEGDNCEGIVDGRGVQMVPAQYGDTDVVSDRWQLGIVFAPGTVDNYDYKSWTQDDVFYLVGSVDVYYMGTLVGSLSRTEYEYADAYGDYLRIKSRDNRYAFYNKAFVKSTFADNETSSEFDYDYDTKVITHVGSNTPAFCEGCTLTEAEVKQTIYVRSCKGLALDGTVLFDLDDEVDYVEDFRGNYARVEKDDKYGLIDRNGNLVLPIEYDDIPVVDYSDYPYFHQGYQPVEKDGCIAIVDMQGNVVYQSRYSGEVARIYNFPFISVEETNGETIVISIAGEFPERFTETRFYGNAQIFTAKNSEGKWVVRDLSNNDVIEPFEADYASFNISNDGSLMNVYQNSTDTLYTLAIDGNFTPLGDLPSLSCACGYTTDEMSFNYCPMCGTQFEK